MGLLDGLIGTDWNDPKSQATLSLAAGLLGPGGFGTGLSRGLAGYQGTMGADAETKLKRAQTADVASQIVLRNLQAQQQQRMFDLQTPFLEEAVRRMQGQGQAPAPTPMPSQPSVMAGSGSAPSFMSSNQTMGGTAPQQAPQASSGQMFPGVPDNVAFATIGTGGFGKIPDLIGKFNEPTEFIKTLRAAGIDPDSPQGRQMIQGQLAKQNYVAPLNARPGSIIRNPLDPRQVLAFNPNMAPGTAPTFDANGNVNSIGVIPGAAAAEQTAAYAKASGGALTQPVTGYEPGTNRPRFGNQLTAAGGNLIDNPSLGQPGSAPGIRYSNASQMDAIRTALPLMQKERDAMPAGPDRDAMDRDIQRNRNALLTGKPYSASTSASSLMPKPALGSEATADASAKDAVESYNAMHSFATGSAQRNISLLQTIQQLADKTLIGPGSSKIQFVNGVLNTLGITPGADQAQNYTIMKKNLNMLVGSQRMGASGGGSDALQNLLEAANPNVAEMNAPAAKEASEELIAYNRMMMAMDRATPNPTKVSTDEFQNVQTKLAPFTDPRLWQLEHAASDKERQRILSLMPPNERQQMFQKAAQARKLGLFD